MNITWIGANGNNFERGRRGKQVDLVVLHWIVGKLAAADATFQDPKRQASSHYGIGNEVIHQYVQESDTAYHAGKFDVNLRSIGIEHEGGPNLPISEETYLTSAQLVREICSRYNIPIDSDHIKRHRDFKATACPGTLDVERIIREAQQVDPQIVIDRLRGERDRNWQLYLDSQNVIAQRDTRILELEGQVKEKDGQITSLQNATITLNERISSMAKAIEADAQEDRDTNLELLKTQGKFKELQDEADSIAFKLGIAPYNFNAIVAAVDALQQPKDKEADKALKDYQKLLEWAMESVGRVKLDFKKWVQIGFNLLLKKLGRG